MRRTLLLLLVLVPGLPAAAAAPREGDYYTITPIAIPEGVHLETSGLTLAPGGRLLACGRRGDVYEITNLQAGASGGPRFRRWAQGLHEPLGVAWHDGWLYAVQKPELTRMRDEDGDGRADLFETVSDYWGFSGDHHEYGFFAGPDRKGCFHVVLCLTGSGSYRADFRGWCLQVRPDGKTVPFATGIRSPGGVGFDARGELFFTDAQGHWNASSSIKHLKPGSFQGNPTGNQAFDLGRLGPLMGARPAAPKVPSRVLTERLRIPEFVPPAVILPHGTMGLNPTGLITDTLGGKFGPFAGQMLVAEHTASRLHRVFLEEVNGVYQGAAFFFLTDGFSSGNIALLMGEDGTLFVGGSSRGWGAKGPRESSLDRVRWTGKVPFEVLEMRARPDGFELTFTHPVDARTAGDPASYSMEAYTYLYHAGYGGPRVDPVRPRVRTATVASDRKSVRLVVDPLTRGHVHELHLKGVRSREGLPLLHPEAFYTLNEVPSK